MKILVYQCNINKSGNSSLIFNDKETRDKKIYSIFEKECCIPSVQNWAKRNGYDYKLYNESTFPDNGFYTEEWILPASIYASERLMRLYPDDEYDYKIYLDCDILIKKTADTFPLTEGISVVAEPDQSFFQKHFYDIKNINLNDHTYVNSGFFCIDKKTCENFDQYIKNRINNKIDINPPFWDQGILNDWIYNTKQKVNYFDSKWNFHVHTLDNEININLNEINFFHFVGKSKFQIKKYYKIISKIL